MSNWEKRRTSGYHSAIEGPCLTDRNLMWDTAWECGRQDLLEHIEEIPTEILERHPKVTALIEAAECAEAALAVCETVHRGHYRGNSFGLKEIKQSLADWGKDGG